MSHSEAYGSPASGRTRIPHKLDLGEFGNAFVSVAAIFLGLTALYHGVFAIYAADDTFFKFTHNGTYALALASYVNGRFIPGILFQGLAAAGIHIHDIWHVLQITAFVALSALSYVFIRCLNVRLSGIECLVFASIVAVIPYNAILLVNKNNALNATIVYTAMSLAILSFSRLEGIKKYILTTLSLFIVASSYQTTIYYFPVFLFSYFIFNGSNKKEVLSGLALGITLCVVAVATYVVIYKTSLGWALEQMALAENADVAQHYGRPRSGLNTLQTLPLSVVLYLQSIARIPFGSEPILWLPVKLFGAGIVFVAYHFWAYDRSGNATPSERFLMRKRRLLVLALIIAVASPIHLLIVNNWLAPRTYAHVGGIWAAVLMSALVYGPQKWRRVNLACSAAFGLMLANHTYWTTVDLGTIYKRDIELANEIIADLKNNPAFVSRKPLTVIGEIPKMSIHSKDILDYFNMAPSKFAKDWSRIGILEEASGERFVRPTADFDAIAEKECATLPASQALYRIRTVPSGTVICLPTSWAANTPVSQ